MSSKKITSVPLAPLPVPEDVTPANQRLDDRGFEEFRQACEKHCDATHGAL